jgi:glutathione S-transferase
VAPQEASQEEACKQGVDAFFEEIEAHLASRGTPWLAGEAISRADCALLPKLYHVLTVLGEDKGYRIPASCPRTQAYVQQGFSHAAFQATTYPPALVLQGWRAKRQ